MEDCYEKMAEQLEHPGRLTIEYRTWPSADHPQGETKKIKIYRYKKDGGRVTKKSANHIQSKYKKTTDNTEQWWGKVDRLFDKLVDRIDDDEIRHLKICTEDGQCLAECAIDQDSRSYDSDSDNGHSDYDDSDYDSDV